MKANEARQLANDCLKDEITSVEKSIREASSGGAMFISFESVKGTSDALFAYLKENGFEVSYVSSGENDICRMTIK